MLVDKLIKEGTLTKDEFVRLFQTIKEKDRERLQKEADRIRHKYYHDKVYLRGLIEFTNYCKNDCYYCGIRKGNLKVSRYRLQKEDILACCEEGYQIGFRTFVMQGGEDPYYTDERLVDIIKEIKASYPECAITLSIGEKSRETYKKLREAGVDRYLLRHETSNEEHYKKLHPKGMGIASRKDCLYTLKELGFQVGAGFMVGSPYQKEEHIAEDLLFLKELQPHMVGIGPFLPHKETPFSHFQKGSFEKTLLLLSIVRILLPKVLLPSTTALGTIHPEGREAGLKSGANVVMPNLSPLSVRKKYLLYDDKICTEEEAIEGIKKLRGKIEQAGYQLSFERGDSCMKWEEKGI